MSAGPQQSGAAPAQAPAAADCGHLPGEVAAGLPPAGAQPAPNKRCPCPNCRQQAALGAGSYSKNVNSSSGPGKQQQQQRQQGAGDGSGKRGSSGKAGGAQATFSVAGLPSKPLMNAATTKDVQGAKPKPKKESLKIKIQKQLARLIKRKKE